MKIPGLALYYQKDGSNAPAISERSNLGKCLCTLGPWLYYGVWNYQIDQLAHGDIYMVGAFMGYFLLNSLKVNFFVALLLAMVGTAILGLVIEYLAYRRFVIRLGLQP